MAATSNIVVHTVKDVTVVTFNDSSILDTAGIQRLGDELNQLVEAKACRKIVLDFNNVKFLSSSALGMLLTLKKKSGAIKGDVVIAGIRPELHKVFKITNLDRIFKFFDTEDKALQSFGIATM